MPGLHWMCALPWGVRGKKAHAVPRARARTGHKSPKSRNAIRRNLPHDPVRGGDGTRKIVSLHRFVPVTRPNMFCSQAWIPPLQLAEIGSQRYLHTSKNVLSIIR